MELKKPSSNVNTRSQISPLLSIVCITILFLVSLYTTYTVFSEHLLPPGIGDMVKRGSLFAAEVGAMVFLHFKRGRPKWGVPSFGAYWPLALWAFYLFWVGYIQDKSYQWQTGLAMLLYFVVLLRIMELLDVGGDPYNSVRSLMWALSITASTGAIVTVFLFFHPMSLGNITVGRMDDINYNANTYLTRAQGIWANPNQVGEMLWMGLSGAVALFFSRPLVTKSLLGAAGLLMFGALVLTSSRSSVLALVLFAVVYFFSTRRFLTLMLLGVFVALGVWFVFHEEQLAGIVHDYARLEAGLNSRDQLWKTGMVVWEEGTERRDRLFGWGLGQWKDVTGDKVAAHNMYLRTLFETGYIGAALLGAVITISIFRLVRFLRSEQYARDYPAFVLALLVGLLAQAMLESFLIGGTTHGNLALTMAILYGLRCSARRKARIMSQGAANSCAF